MVGLLSACGHSRPDYFGIGGYAIIQGEIVRVSGNAYSGSMCASCALAAADWRAVCRVGAPRGAPPFVTVVDTVVFAPTRKAEVENTVNLYEGQTR